MKFFQTICFCSTFLKSIYTPSKNLGPHLFTDIASVICHSWKQNKMEWERKKNYCHDESARQKKQGKMEGGLTQKWHSWALNMRKLTWVDFVLDFTDVKTGFSLVFFLKLIIGTQKVGDIGRCLCRWQHWAGYDRAPPVSSKLDFSNICVFSPALQPASELYRWQWSSLWQTHVHIIFRKFHFNRQVLFLSATWVLVYETKMNTFTTFL